jgi:hypothetical protein
MRLGAIWKSSHVSKAEDILRFVSGKNPVNQVMLEVSIEEMVRQRNRKGFRPLPRALWFGSG